MKFCRSCGCAIPQGGTAPGAMGGPQMGQPPMGQMGAPLMGGQMGGQIGGPMGGPPMANHQLPTTAPGLLAPTPMGGQMGGPPMGGQMGGAMPMPGPMPTPMPMPAPLATGGPLRPSTNAMVTCPRCGTPTPSAFAYCQQCGLHMQAIAPTDPGPRSAGGGPLPSMPMGPQPAPLPPPPIDPQGATMAQTGPDAIRAGSIVRPQGPTGSQPPIAQNAQIAQTTQPLPPQQPSAPSPQAVAWGTAVLVNRDGTDGDRFPLMAEYTVVGRAGADIAFPDDRFLARQHARLERSDGGAKVVPLDTLNGVFRKADAPVELVDGSIVLVGREVLRFELVEQEERVVQPLVRHGVALFGSPPREPWGRLVQIVPSGGWRDLRHLATEEIVLGREEGDIVFRDDAFMSRRHAALTWDGHRVQITDLGSSNGTFVRIDGPISIKTGDHLRMGDQLLRIELGR